MRFGFVNNFSQLLAATLEPGATSMTLNGGGALLSNANLVYSLTLDDGDGKVEIVYVTAADGDTLTISKGEEGTSDLQWPPGSVVEQRVTAAAAGRFLQAAGETNGGVGLAAVGVGSVAVAPGAVAVGQAYELSGPPQAVAPNTLAMQAGSVASGPGALALAGGQATEGGFAIGPGSEAYAPGALAITGGPDGSAMALGPLSAVLIAGTVSGASAFAANGTAQGDGSAALAGGATGNNAAGAFAAGPSSNASQENSLALMGGTSDGVGACSFGENAAANGDRGFSWGADSQAGEDCISIGTGSSSQYQEGVGAGQAIGKNSAAAAGAMAHGEESQAQAPGGMAAGKSSSSSAPENVAHGPWASAPSPYSVAMGPYASTANVPGGFQVNAISYLRAVPDDTGTYAGPPPSAARRASQQVVVATDTLDLVDDTAAVTLSFPPNTMLFIDAIDVVIVDADAPAGSPEIRIGPDDATPAAYLAATPVTATAVGERETHSPLVADGVTSLRVETATAGTGTLAVKVVFRGYVMEL